MIEFKDPPKPSRRAGRDIGPETRSIIVALKSRPDEWALIKEDVFVSASTWWKKRPGIEAKASTIGKPKGKCDVYARWVGTP